jgi:hypothetical protein
VPVAILTKAGSYQTVLVPGKHFKFEQPVAVTEEEKAILRETDWFKFESDEVFETVPSDTAPVKGGVVIRRKGKAATAAPALDEVGVEV